MGILDNFIHLPCLENNNQLKAIQAKYLQPRRILQLLTYLETKHYTLTPLPFTTRHYIATLALPNIVYVNHERHMQRNNFYRLTNRHRSNCFPCLKQEFSVTFQKKGGQNLRNSRCLVKTVAPSSSTSGTGWHQHTAAHLEIGKIYLEPNTQKISHNNSYTMLDCHLNFGYYC